MELIQLVYATMSYGLEFSTVAVQGAAISCVLMVGIIKHHLPFSY